MTNSDFRKSSERIDLFTGRSPSLLSVGVEYRGPDHRRKRKANFYDRTHLSGRLHRNLQFGKLPGVRWSQQCGNEGIYGLIFRFLVYRSGRGGPCQGEQRYLRFDPPISCLHRFRGWGGGGSMMLFGQNC